jgi:hypothetical protein
MVGLEGLEDESKPYSELEEQRKWQRKLRGAPVFRGLILKLWRLTLARDGPLSIQSEFRVDVGCVENVSVSCSKR